MTSTRGLFAIEDISLENTLIAVDTMNNPYVQLRLVPVDAAHFADGFWFFGNHLGVEKEQGDCLWRTRRYICDHWLVNK